MKNYVVLYDVVNRLTSDPTLRVFFTLYLMAETENEKAVVSARFRRDANLLDEPKRKNLFAAMEASFKRLPEMAADLLQRVVAAKAKEAVLA